MLEKNGDYKIKRRNDRNKDPLEENSAQRERGSR